MPLKEPEWMAAVLGIQHPWQIVDVRLNAQGGVSIQVEHDSAQQRSWFSRRPVAARRLRWDHIGLAGRRCELVLSLPEGVRMPDGIWTGEPDMPFTRGLSRLVLDLMLEGATVAQICRMLELPISDLWKFKYRLEQTGTRPPEPREAGRSRSAAPAATAATPARSHAAMPAPAAAPRPAAAPLAAPVAAPAPFVAQPGAPANSLLPAEDSPVWLALLKGQVTLDVQALSLKLLLSKLLREAQSHSDPDLHQQAAQSLHQYFRRNQALLGAETAQLAAAAQAPAAAPSTPGLPDVSDPLWLDLLNGERDLDVRTLSLRLLLSKLRGQARGMKDDEVRMLKLVELHRYFEKNQAALRHEISQLHHWSVH